MSFFRPLQIILGHMATVKNKYFANKVTSSNQNIFTLLEAGHVESLKGLTAKGPKKIHKVKEHEHKSLCNLSQYCSAGNSQSWPSRSSLLRDSSRRRRSRRRHKSIVSASHSPYSMHSAPASLPPEPSGFSTAAAVYVLRRT